MDQPDRVAKIVCENETSNHRIRNAHGAKETKWQRKRNISNYP